MIFVFGSVEKDGGVWENLKTVGDEHTDLTGVCTVEDEYPDCTIRDRFRVVRKYRSDEDEGGKCYDWYLIDDRNRDIDRTKQFKAQLQALQGESSTTIADLESALVELAELIGG